MNSESRELFFKFLKYSNKGIEKELKNLINIIIKSDLNKKENNSSIISILCCWTLTTYAINTLFLLNYDDMIKISEGINIIDTYKLLNKLINEK
ncbi:hypothetical protein Mgra_00007578 [Meloidogyne graminicola]|uniref:Uncharacterized protein n=1 Tax=Meloidogyne graminicola TaxID=189291 RepID=A0A8S9ZI67_9BILA|nr:hypothetical protein Mgra_00007578 [Meloidogyne graminicola]